MTDSPKMQLVKLDHIYLDLENPRHDLYETEAQAIDFLCRKENVLPLAKDIVRYGVNPLELLAVIPDEAAVGNHDGGATYIVAEGIASVTSASTHRTLTTSRWDSAPSFLTAPTDQVL
ncbi:MAG: hypothetical protein ABJA20_14160 [Novosphingobium sp.]